MESYLKKEDLWDVSELSKFSYKGKVVKFNRLKVVVEQLVERTKDKNVKNTYPTNLAQLRTCVIADLKRTFEPAIKNDKHISR